jgi:hypothetical protein
MNDKGCNDAVSCEHSASRALGQWQKISFRWKTSLATGRLPSSTLKETRKSARLPVGDCSVKNSSHEKDRVVFLLEVAE